MPAFLNPVRFPKPFRRFARKDAANRRNLVPISTGFGRCPSVRAGQYPARSGKRASRLRSAFRRRQTLDRRPRAFRRHQNFKASGTASAPRPASTPTPRQEPTEASTELRPEVKGSPYDAAHSRDPRSAQREQSLPRSTQAVRTQLPRYEARAALDDSWTDNIKVSELWRSLQVSIQPSSGCATGTSIHPTS